MDTSETQGTLKQAIKFGASVICKPPEEYDVAFLFYYSHTHMISHDVLLQLSGIFRFKRGDYFKSVHETGRHSYEHGVLDLKLYILATQIFFFRFVLTTIYKSVLENVPEIDYKVFEDTCHVKTYRDTADEWHNLMKRTRKERYVKIGL